MNGSLIYVAKRFGQFLFVVLTGVTLAFLIAHFSPVDPVEQTVSLVTNFGATDPRSVEILRQSLRELYGTEGSPYDEMMTYAVIPDMPPGPEFWRAPIAGARTCTGNWPPLCATR